MTNTSTYEQIADPNRVLAGQPCGSREMRRPGPQGGPVSAVLADSADGQSNDTLARPIYKNNQSIQFKLIVFT
jgi:hypothetical protein